MCLLHAFSAFRLFSQRSSAQNNRKCAYRPIRYMFYYDLSVYLIETPLNAFANRVDPDQTALVRAALSGSTLFAYRNMIYLTFH